MSLNELAKEAHQIAVEHGWWDPEPTFGELIALMHSELSEALEEYRAGRGMVWHKVEEIKARYPGESDVKLVSQKPEGIAVELADCIIRILDWADKYWYDIEEEVRDVKKRAEKGEDNIDGFAGVVPERFGELVEKLHRYITSMSTKYRNAARTIVCIISWAEKEGLDMESIIREKMDYNRTRPYRHGGKKL